MSEIKLDFSCSPTVARAMLDLDNDYFISAVVGPAGTGKTFGCIRAFVMRAWNQPPSLFLDKEGRKIRKRKLSVIRNTYRDLTDSTLPTCEAALEVFRGMGAEIEVTRGNMPSVRLFMPHPDKKTFLLYEIDFVAVDSEGSFKKLLGREMSDILVDEVSEISKSVVTRAVSRIGRYPSVQDGGCYRPKIVLTSNGPRTNHFLYSWKNGEDDALMKSLAAHLPAERAGYFVLYQQPPALLRPADARDWRDGAKWLPNPTAENIPNLTDGYTYYYNMLIQSDTDIRRFVEGFFIPVYDGMPVYPEFREETHVIPFSSIEPIIMTGIGMSFDFGRTPVCLFWCEPEEGRLVIFDEFMEEAASITELMNYKVVPAYVEKYRRPPVVWATGDPAGLIEGQATSVSPYSVLSARPYDLPMIPPGVNNQIGPRIESFRERLNRMVRGTPSLRITDNCKFLISALKAGYVYEPKRNGSSSDTPTKSHEGWVSDLADAASYGTLYHLIRHRSKKKVQYPSGYADKARQFDRKFGLVRYR